MVRCRNNRYKNHTRISQPNQDIHALPERRLADLAFLERAPENTSVVEHGAADDEGVTEMHARHRSEGVNVIAAHPDACCVVMTDGVEEAVLLRQKTRWHAWVQSEGHESKEIRQGEGAADCCESWVGWSDVVVPGDETDSAGDVYKSISSIEDRQCSLMAGHKPMLNTMFGEGEEEAERPELFEFEDGQAVGL